MERMERRLLYSSGQNRTHMASRRQFLFSVAGLPFALRNSLFAAGNTGNNPTWQENKNAGDPNWQIGLAPYRRSDDFTNQLERLRLGHEHQ